jgi:hypothetical protein
MKIQINTNSSIKGDQRLEEIAEGVVKDTLERFRDDVTRVEVHLRDVNRQKGGSDDKQCTMEARIQGRKPTAVTHNAGNVEDALYGAAGKLERALDSELGKLKDHRR